MKFRPVKYVLRNGKSITIREAVIKDAGGLRDAMSTYISQSENLITLSEEFQPTIRAQKDWIQLLHDGRNSILLVAVYENVIIANLDVKGEVRKKLRHNATLGIGILKQWQNIGLGEAMMSCAIAWARQSLTLETLWLHVFHTNTAAIHLYKKMGFEIVATQKDYIKEIDGALKHNIIMQLSVK